MCPTVNKVESIILPLCPQRMGNGTGSRLFSKLGRCQLQARDTMVIPRDGKGLQDRNGAGSPLHCFQHLTQCFQYFARSRG